MPPRAQGGVEIFADPVLAAPHEHARFGADDLHLPVFGLHFQGDAHLLGAARGIGGVLARPGGGHLAAQQGEALLDVLHRLEAPDVDAAAALHALPHVHEIVPVHAVHEMLGRIDDEGVVHLAAQFVNKGPRQFHGRTRLPRDAADDAAVEHDVMSGPAGGAHAADDVLGLGGDVLLVELVRLRAVRTEGAVAALPVLPEAEDVPRELMARAQQDVRRCAALGQDEVRFLPGAGKSDGDPVEVEGLAGAVMDDGEPVRAQMAQQVVLARALVVQDALP